MWRGVASVECVASVDRVARVASVASVASVARAVWGEAGRGVTARRLHVEGTH